MKHWLQIIYKQHLIVCHKIPIYNLKRNSEVINECGECSLDSNKSDVLDFEQLSHVKQETWMISLWMSQIPGYATT